jgi:hypothetical protein
MTQSAQDLSHNFANVFTQQKMHRSSSFELLHVSKKEACAKSLLKVVKVGCIRALFS